MRLLTPVSRYSSVVLVVVLTAASFSLAQAANPNADFGQAQAASHRVCDHNVSSNFAACNAHVKVDPAGKPQNNNAPSGLSPQQMRAAYNLGSGKTSVNRTIAIVDAYDNPNAFNDLKTYSSQFGLTQLASCPVSAGTTTRPCFQKVDQNGGTNYPVANSSWALEIALDVQTAHAVCENCNILLVEAGNNNYANLFAALDRAVAMGATVVSNSYSSDEWAGETAYDSHLTVPGVAMTFSAGDAGYGPQYPAASPYVTAVGGTTLNMNGTTYVSESAWSGSGSGCSLYEAKPAFQTDSACSNRMIADVSAVADPSTGAAIYNSYNFRGKGSPWFQVGGTSLSAPLVAGIYALAGVPSGSQANSLPYSHSSSLHDIISGSNGSCGGMYFCTGLSGYDGPTGLGTPLGLAAF